jgi:acyl-CoA reductase-like NAD-dependent aldehyde dehydrogenase
MKEHRMLSMTIDGKPAHTLATFDVVNPATGLVEAQALDCTPEQLDQAMESAEHAFTTWKRDDDTRRQALRDPAHAPFSGAKHSGLGVANGEDGLLSFTEQQVVHIARAGE